MNNQLAITDLTRCLDSIARQTDKLMQAGDFEAKDGYAEDILRIVAYAMEVVKIIKKET